MKIYLHIVIGVYTKAILGAFTSSEEAHRSVETAESLEVDDYHDHEVHEIEVDAPLDYCHKDDGRGHNYSHVTTKQGIKL